LKSARVLNTDVIRTLKNAYSQQAASPSYAAISRPTDRCETISSGAVHAENESRARVFDCEDDAIAAILGGKIRGGDIVVIRYEGRKAVPV